MHPALSVDCLTVSVPGRRLVDGVSFGVAHDERVALLGASGSGKSLTAAAVLGSLGPAFRVGGSVVVLGHTGRALPRGAVAAVHQDSLSALNPLVTVGAQLAVPLRRLAGTGRREARGVVGRMLEAVGIDDPERAMAGYAAELSGGQRQRVCIALALLCRARLLVADEPTTALDVVNQARVLDVLRAYGREHGAAILFITHDLPVAASLCTRAVVLESGRVVEDASMDELIGNPRHPYARSLVAAASATCFPAAGPALAAAR